MVLTEQVVQAELEVHQDLAAQVVVQDQVDPLALVELAAHQVQAVHQVLMEPLAHQDLVAQVVHQDLVVLLALVEHLELQVLTEQVVLQV